MLILNILAFGPDIDGISLLDLFEFIKYPIKFGALGPRYIHNKTNRNLIQTNKLKKINRINCLSGAVLFFDKKIFGQLKDLIKIFFFFLKKMIIVLEQIKIVIIAIN